jgi:pimeloyl-ACP methyl ester carboxylesterase
MPEATTPAGPIHYRVTGEGTTTVVFVRGFLDEGRAWDGVVGHLAATDCRAVSVDLRGHGSSSAEVTLSLESCAEDVVAVIADIGDASDVVVVGHSMSGQIAELEPSRRTPTGRAPPRVPWSCTATLEAHQNRTGTSGGVAR